ncbi:MAG: Fic family protein [archaeon]|nr:Fic family protein [Nanoarchaeota archaeon]
MVFVSKKVIKGKPRYYLEKSLRFPDHKTKKFSVYLKDYSADKPSDLAKYKEILNDKVIEAQKEFVIKYYKKDYIFTEETLKKLENIKVGYEEVLKKLTKQQLKDLLDRFTVNFTYESNAIEGNSLTLKDVTFIIKEGKVLKNKDLREVYETLNTRKAIDILFAGKFKINNKDIIKLHSILIENTGVAERYKRFPNFLLGRNLETTPPEKVEAEMNKLVSWYNENKELHPLQLATIFHGKFERIHPFEDGNGRVGRLLINVILMEKGYPPLIIRKTQRIKYFNALQAFDNKHFDKLYRFVLGKYKDTFEKFFMIYIKYLD